jgi:large subunit ribosomal protein L2
MAVIKMKPTSPGHRGMVKISRDHLHKGEGYAPLLEPQFQKAGRNNNGHITGAPQGRRPQAPLPRGRLPCATRTAFRPRSSASSTTRTARPTSRWCATPTASAATSSRRAAWKWAPAHERFSEAPIRAGNTLPIRNIPVGSTIHCIELQIGKGAQIARSAGTSATLLAREGTYAQVRMRSGEVRKIHIECRATIGEVANEEHSLRQLGKAGVKRHMGIRPTVRGVVMNPVDHPHGGGEGKTGEGRHPVDPWGNLTKGYRTRNNKRTQTSIIVSRRKK